MKTLRSILYVSAAVRPPSYDEVMHLLNRARERNAEHSVTGILLLVDSSFMQYIEGPEHSLNAIFQVIKDDPMHKSIFEIVNEPIAERLYSEWNMAFVTTDFKAFTDSDQYNSLLSPKLAKSDVNPTDIAGLLNKFWNRYRPRES
jgi:hypothetical protein